MKNVAWKSDLLPLLPKRLAEAINLIQSGHAGTLEEIRLRVNCPVQAFGSGWEVFFGRFGETAIAREALTVAPEDCIQILDAIAFHSVYAIEEELKRGFITLPGGYRVGLAGRALVSAGKLERLSGCTFFSFRVARQTKGCADSLIPSIIMNGQPVSTLILSPPGCGKTTYLRDITRQLSDGGYDCPPQRVSVIDERSEIAGCNGGIPQNDVGIRTDVLDGCPKAEGMELMLRALSPQVMITDELGREEDYQAVLAASNSGVVIIASAHVGSIHDIQRRPFLKRLYESKIFERYVMLDRSKGPGTITGVYDQELQVLPMRRC